MTEGSHRVAFYADIYYDSERSPAFWTPPENLDVDVLLLGGDIHYSPRLFGDMLAEIRRTQRDSTRIVIVPGNGEYIRQELGESRREYRAAVAAVQGAHWLDDETLVLPRGLRIIGSTLWSHVADERIDHYTRKLDDNGLKGVDDIRLGDRYLTLRDTNVFHETARSFIAAELAALGPAERAKTIVCTHFWPTLRPWLDEAGQPRPGDPETEWLHTIGTDLDDLIAGSGVRYWLCGHSHTTHRATIADTLVVSNPRAGDGPGNRNPEFAENLVVEL